MHTSNKITQSNLDKIRQEKDKNLIDNTTGQELFHPKINKSSTSIDILNARDNNTYESL